MKYCWLLVCLAGAINHTLMYAEKNISHEGDLLLISNIEYGTIFVNGKLTVQGSLRCKKLIALDVYVVNDLVVGFDAEDISSDGGTSTFVIDVAKKLEVKGACVVLGCVRASDIIVQDLDALGVFAHTLTVGSLVVKDENFHVTSLYRLIDF